MLGRRALCRLTAGAPRPKRELSRYIHRTLFVRNAAPSSSLFAFRHSYATTTAATEPTATVKKAVKAAAAEGSAPKTKAAAKPRKTPVAEKPTAKKPTAKKTTATKTTAKKNTAKKTTAKKSTAKKTTAKSPTAKTARAKKAAQKKAAPRKRAAKKRVPLTPEQKRKAKISDLRKRTLKEPVTRRAMAAHTVFLSDQIKGHSQPAGIMKEMQAKFKALTPAEREHYNHLAHERSAAQLAEYQAWIRSYKPEEIHAANLARRHLRKLLKDTQKGAPRHTAALVDDRRVKQATNAYAHFFAERARTGDFKGIPVSESGKLMGEEWRALSAGERKKYQDMYEEDKARRQRELEALA